MKQNYVIERGIENIEFKRGVQIDGKSSNLVVGLSQNNKKGMFSIHTGLTAQQITGDEALDKAALLSLVELQMAAIEYGKQWKEEWLQAKRESGEEEDGQTQLNFGFGESDENE